MSKGTVLVTGASAGYGFATAERFVAEGYRVIAAARRLDKLEAFAKAHPGQVLALQLDVTDIAGMEKAIAGLPADFAAIDVLVNNAGLALGLEPAAQAKISDWETMIATNCTGLVALSRIVLPGMVARGRGHVINLGSVAGTYPYPGGNVYGATKAFVEQFTLNLRSDLHGTGVRATVVEPGMSGGTEFSVVRFAGDATKAAKVYEGADALVANDIAECVYWAASLPAHVNINKIEVMPTCQSFSPFQIYRKG